MPRLSLARLGILTGLVLSTGRAMGAVDISRMLGSDICGRSETLSLGVYSHVLGAEAACASTLSLVLAGVASLAFFLLRWLEKPSAQ